jgi:hypothetical protein
MGSQRKKGGGGGYCVVADDKRLRRKKRTVALLCPVTITVQRTKLYDAYFWGFYSHIIYFSYKNKTSQKVKFHHNSSSYCIWLIMISFSKGLVRTCVA